MKIVDLDPKNESLVRQLAELLVDVLNIGWPTIEKALEEVRESFPDARISRIALEDDLVLGWVGGSEEYDGHTWELHTLAVRRDRQGQAIGRARVADVASRTVEARGGTGRLGAAAATLIAS